MKRCSILLAMLAGLATLGPSTVARADRLSATRSQPVVEVSHTVDVAIDEGVARYTVRRTFANNGTVPEEAVLRIELAHGAAVTGLRIRARERWYDGDLMDAEEALAKYRELTGVGKWEIKDPALLQWVWCDVANLRVFPVLPGGVSTVEYTLTAPLEYRGGRHVLTYPLAAVSDDSDSLALTDPVLRVDPGHGGAGTQIRVGGQRVAADTPVVLRAQPGPAWVGDGGPEPRRGYLFSKLSVERDEPVKLARVHVDIDHTYRGDLVVDLVTPDGEHLPVTDGAGDKNDVRGEFEVALADGTRSAGDWHLVVADRAGLDVGTLDAWSIKLERAGTDAAVITARADDLPRFIPDAPDDDGAGGHATIEVEPAPVRTLAARLGRVVASEEHGFHRLEIDAAPRLSELPKKASVVFVLDRSRSVSEEHLAAQLRIVAAYRAHVPDAAVEIVAFDRRARRVLGDFVTADKFAAALTSAQAAGALATGNGSALDEGLALAARTLAGRRGPTRIVAITDALLRTRFANALADGALAPAPTSTVTHVVLPYDDEEAALVRDDNHPLAPIAAGHRGVLFSASAPEGDKGVAPAMLALVRPVAIDDFAVRGMDLDGARELPTSLREGAGYRAMLGAQDPARRVVLTGKLWATPFRRVVTHTERFDIATAAFVFSQDEHHDLSPEEMRVVAYRGRAVSPVTSYLAIEPGVRPSRDGLDEEGLGFGGGGGSATGRAFGGGGGLSTPPPSLRALLADDIERCVAAHGPGAQWQMTLAIETTAIEIVDVEARGVVATGAPLRDCLVEAAWSLELPPAAWSERMQHTIVLP